MANLIDKDALVAEIEKLKGKVNDGSSYCNGWQHALRILELSLGTLEVKEVNLDESSICNELAKYIGVYSSKDLALAKHFCELVVSCPINNINIEEVKAAAKAWSEDDENTRGCDYIGAAVAERAFVACAEWLINKEQKGE